MLFLPDEHSYRVFYERQSIVNGYFTLTCHVVPILTFPVYLEAFYCVFYKSKQFDPKYAVLLRIHMFLNLFGELHQTVFFLPNIILPGFCISAEGLLSLLKVSPSWQFFGMSAIFQMSSATMVHLFLCRLKQTVPLGLKNWKFVRLSADFLTVFFYFTAFIALLAFSLLDEDQYIAKKRMEKNFLVAPPNLWAPNFITSGPENPHFETYLNVICAELIIFSLNVIIVPTVSFSFLSKSPAGKSNKHTNANRKTLRMLMFQLATHCLFYILPTMCFALDAVFQANNIAVLSFGFLIFSLHGIACTLTLLLANKPFRLTAKTHFRKVFCCCSKSADEVVHFTGSGTDLRLIPKITAVF